MPDGMLTKECPQMQLIDTVLNPMLNSADFIDKKNAVIYKFSVIRYNIFKYYDKYYKDEILKDESQYAFFLFDVGMFTGTMSYYKKNRNLTKDHITDLNKIY